ncbi:MAG: Zn-ribbon domain-containing protein [Nanoarchaeota archaeon]|nr:Zn-ribbon domain-containing protein [Nanoarchaeota archaeon]
MPHQCVKCGIMYEDTANELLKGCSCGSKFFFFVNKEHIKEVQEETKKLTISEKKEIEEDVIDIIGPGIDRSMPVILNLETIRIKKPGKFEIDLVKIFKGAPLVYKIEEGKYFIDLPSTFQLGRRKDKKK